MVMKKPPRAHGCCLPVPASSPVGQGGKPRVFQRGWVIWGTHRAQQRGWQCPANPGSLQMLCALLCWLSPKEIKAHTGLWQQAAMRESCFYIQTP